MEEHLPTPEEMVRIGSQNFCLDFMRNECGEIYLRFSDGRNGLMQNMTLFLAHGGTQFKKEDPNHCGSIFSILRGVFNEYIGST